MDRKENRRREDPGRLRRLPDSKKEGWMTEDPSENGTCPNRRLIRFKRESFSKSPSAWVSQTPATNKDAGDREFLLSPPSPAGTLFRPKSVPEKRGHGRRAAPEDAIWKRFHKIEVKPFPYYRKYKRVVGDFLPRREKTPEPTADLRPKHSGEAIIHETTSRLHERAVEKTRKHHDHPSEVETLTKNHARPKGTSRGAG